MGNGVMSGSKLAAVVSPSSERQIGDGDGSKGHPQGPLSKVKNNGGVKGSDDTGAKVNQDNAGSVILDEPENSGAQSLQESYDKKEKLNKNKKREEIADMLDKLVERLQNGDYPPMEDMQTTMALASRALHRNKMAIRMQQMHNIHQSEECFETIRDVEIREWLSTTFTNSETMSKASYHPRSPLTKFRAAANSVIIGQFLKSFTSLHRHDMAMPSKAKQYLQDFINSWSFNIFKFKILCNRSPLKLIAYHTFKQYGLLQQYQIPLIAFDSYMTRVEEYYDCHNNPYHNSMHGADVTQSLNSLMTITGVIDVMTDIEKLASILAALIHDVDHPGKNNQFFVNQSTELAKLYHDKSVLENHHLRIAFDLIYSDNSTNFLINLTKDDFRNFRSLVIDMVLATDMAHHFNMVKNVAAILANPEGGIQLLEKERHIVFQCLLHMVDISHPGKPWSIHHDWSLRITEEFFLQGDIERELNMPISPLCDRTNQNLPHSQTSFAEIIVAPLFAVSGDMIDLLLTTAAEKKLIRKVGKCERIWDNFLQENVAQWKELKQLEEQAKQAKQSSLSVEPPAEVAHVKHTKEFVDKKKDVSKEKKLRPVHIHNVSTITVDRKKPKKQSSRNRTLLTRGRRVSNPGTLEAIPETPNSLVKSKDKSYPDNPKLPPIVFKHSMGEITHVKPCQPHPPSS